jgi:hypothetical protein
MTMAALRGNNATLLTEAAAMGRRRHGWQRWQQKQRDDNDGNDHHKDYNMGQALRLRPAVTGAMWTITATTATARTKNIMMTTIGRGEVREIGGNRDSLLTDLCLLREWGQDREGDGDSDRDGDGCCCGCGRGNGGLQWQQQNARAIA